MLGVSLHFPVSTLPHHVSRVLGASAVEDVRWITTWRVIAGMAGLVWPISTRKVKGHAVCAVDPVLNPESPVTGRLSISQPRPTFIRGADVYLRPKPLVQGQCSVGGRACPRAKAVAPPTSELAESLKRLFAMFAVELERHSCSSYERVCLGCRTTNPTPLIVPQVAPL
jgi:hypothetical protein